MKQNTMGKMKHETMRKKYILSLKTENELNEILKIMFESLTKLEQNAAISKDIHAKGNGYRFRQDIGFEESYKIRMPSDRLDVF